ncbi:uncharacterized protein KD926_003057 [Aspergillus affinis]|uniref:uncharacterized protein n=1 Tax=Aspergillus affinis TaxID=1070780 RepID=UPI0022FF1AF4|nr:uncharacterized protein KD926_003057 [Aspergillus affinis]KAI9043707.1 hypothetical protein KD926_003057 [Aspergillus affinis]
MSHYTQPKQILKKEMSPEEYSLLEEWGPQTIQGCRYSEGSSTALAQLETMPNTVHEPFHRRLKNRSSSLFEEWKVQATRREMANEVIRLKEDKKHQAVENAFLAPDAAVALGDNFGGRNEKQDGAVAAVQLSANRFPNVQSSPNNATRIISDALGPLATRLLGNHPVIVPNNRKGPSSLDEVKKIAVSQTTYRSGARSSNRPRNNSEPTNPNLPMISGARTTPKIVSEPKKSVGNQSAPRTEVGGYTAPNGTHLRKNELHNLSRGVKILNKDTAYFLPSFVEDPWKDVKPIMTECDAALLPGLGSFDSTV